MVISIVNQKGGVGKTTTSVNLADNLARNKMKTLLIDLDPQGNATSSFGLDKNRDLTIYDGLINEVLLDELIIKEVRKNLDIVPANIDLAGAEIEMVPNVSRETILDRLITDEIRQHYDVILIDCSPSLGLLTLNALVACDGILVPIQAEYYALEGVTQLIETYEMVKENLNPNLTIFGVLITMYDIRTQLSKQVADEIIAYFKDDVFETMIPRNVRLSEAPSFGLPIHEHDRWSKGARAYRGLAKEVIQRLNID